MRTRAVIENEIFNETFNDSLNLDTNKRSRALVARLQTEILLDIRDLVVSINENIRRIDDKYVRNIR